MGIGSHFRCPNCKKSSPAGEWNNKTRAQAAGMPQLKNYRRIQDSGLQRRWYVCPLCGVTSFKSNITMVRPSSLIGELVEQAEEVAVDVNIINSGTEEGSQDSISGTEVERQGSEDERLSGICDISETSERGESVV